jgi:uncharacterized protein
MVTQSQIDAFVEGVARAFSPDKIILFGSRAAGKEQDHSDVDLLVVMEHGLRNVQMAIKIRETLDPRFALDLLVRKPTDLEKRLAMRDYFMMDIVEKGKVLYARDA